VILWYGLLLLFAFLSLVIDMDSYLPQQIFRHIWNLLIFATGVYFLFRMRMKAKAGEYEKMQKEYQQLTQQVEKSRIISLLERIAILEKRVDALEGKN
jgi:hypothetical protein